MVPFTSAHGRSKLKMPSSEFFRFHQIPNFLRSLGPSVLEDPRVTPYKSWCAQEAGGRGGISILYRLLLDSPDKSLWRGIWIWPLGAMWNVGIHPFIKHTKV